MSDYKDRIVREIEAGKHDDILRRVPAQVRLDENRNWLGLWQVTYLDAEGKVLFWRQYSTKARAVLVAALGLGHDQ